MNAKEIPAANFCHDGREYGIVEINGNRFAVEASALAQNAPLVDPYSGGSVILDESDLELRVISGRISGDDDDTVEAVLAPPGEHQDLFIRRLLVDGGVDPDSEEDRPKVFIVFNVSLGEFLASPVRAVGA
jgi:hypothetical protein